MRRRRGEGGSRSGALDRVCLGSFTLPVLRAGARREPRHRDQRLAGGGQLRALALVARAATRPGAYRAFQVPEKAGRLRRGRAAFIRAVHKAGCAVQVWTVNEEADMTRLFDWGVDGIITDRPDIAVRVRDQWVEHRRRVRHAHGG